MSSATSTPGAELKWCQYGNGAVTMQAVMHPMSDTVDRCGEGRGMHHQRPVGSASSRPGAELKWCQYGNSAVTTPGCDAPRQTRLTGVEGRGTHHQRGGRPVGVDSLALSYRHRTECASVEQALHCDNVLLAYVMPWTIFSVASEASGPSLRRTSRAICVA